MDNNSLTLRGTKTASGGGGASSQRGQEPKVNRPLTRAERLKRLAALMNRDVYTITLPVTMSDLVNFRPAPAVDHMEPNGWMIVGLDTNFFATVSEPVQTGELLGQPASVRFTPVGYHWTYGDGHVAYSTTRGAPWATLGVREFDPTATSHVYTKPGGYDIDLTVDFAAEYRYASSGWIPVNGTLSLPANRLHAVAGQAKTVLIAKDCLANPTGPGC